MAEPVIHTLVGSLFYVITVALLLGGSAAQCRRPNGRK